MRIEALDTMDGAQRMRRTRIWEQHGIQPQQPQATPQLTPADLLQIIELMTQLITELIGQLAPSNQAGQMPFDNPGQDRPLHEQPAQHAATPGSARTPEAHALHKPEPAPVTPPEPVTPEPAPVAATEQPSDPVTPGEPVAGATLTGSVDGGGPNSVLVRNRSDQPIQVAMFRNLAPGMHPNFEGPNAQFTIPANGELRISVPDDWQGRLQKYSGSTQDPSNWAELNFEGSTGKIWFNESDIPGRNSSMLITAPDGAVAGSTKSVLGDAPPGVVAVDSSGQKVIKPPQWFTGVTDQGAVDYLNQALGNTNAYVLPDDHLAVRVSEADTLTIDIGTA
jgi:hypothetical protein